MTALKWVFGVFILVAAIVGGLLFKKSESPNLKSGDKIGEQSVNELSLTDTTNIFIEYQEGGGFDIYEDGDRYGYKMSIRFSGDISIFERIYRNRDGEQRIEEIKIITDTVSKNTIDSLAIMIEEFGFYNLPQRIPDVSPLEVEIRAPAKQVYISARKVAGDQLKTVKVNLGADREHYPKEFFELYGVLERLLQQFKNN